MINTYRGAQKEMKLAHISDLHLGKTLYNYSLIEDQEYILDEIIKILVKKKIDVLMIAGDVYDKNVAPEAGFKSTPKVFKPAGKSQNQSPYNQR